MRSGWDQLPSSGSSKLTRDRSAQTQPFQPKSPDIAPAVESDTHGLRRSGHSLRGTRHSVRARIWWYIESTTRWHLLARLISLICRKEICRKEKTGAGRAILCSVSLFSLFGGVSDRCSEAKGQRTVVGEWRGLEGCSCALAAVETRIVSGGITSYCVYNREKSGL